MDEKRTVLLLRGTSEQIAQQAKDLSNDCVKRNWKAMKIFEEHADLGMPLGGRTAIRSIQRMAAYREFDVLFIDSKAVLGNDKAEAREFFKFLNENGVSLISRQDGILNLMIVRHGE